MNFLEVMRRSPDMDPGLLRFDVDNEGHSSTSHFCVCIWWAVLHFLRCQSPHIRSAKLAVDNEVISQISRGLMVLVGIGSGLALLSLYRLDSIRSFNLQSR